jgi:hypothetical protein
VQRSSKCNDPVVGGILAGWRYDISGIATDMRADYEHHLVACEWCRSRQRLHRRIDIGLIVLTSAAAVLFAFGFFVVPHFHIATQHSVLLQIGMVLGCAISVLLAILVAISTPAPLVVADAAMLGARRVHDSLPEGIKDRLPEELRVKLSDQ